MATPLTRPRPRGIERRPAFTLLEILMAVAILGSAVVIVMGNINHSITLYRVARETVTATTLAQSKLAELLSSRDSIRPSSEAGRFKEDSRFGYTVTVSDATLPGFEKDDLKGILRATVVVQWDSPHTREVRLVQLVSAEAGGRR
ncbi:MAG: type II secretion system protein [Candidatus Riflebacteria bacterium]|nr:type II secretion system protein [Candidatus Riflebacteria bacterium]